MTIVNFSADNRQLLAIAKELEKALRCGRDVAETILVEQVQRARDLAAAYQAEITAVLSTAGGNRHVADVYSRERAALAAFVDAPDFRTMTLAIKALASLPPRGH